MLLSLDNWQELTIGQALANTVDAYRDRLAFVFPDDRFTFGDLDERSDQVARAFLAMGIGHGDRVAIWMAGYKEWTYLYFGLLKIGAVIVPLNTRYRPEEIEYALSRSHAGVLVFKNEVSGEKDYGKLLLEVCPELIAARPGALQSRRVPDLRTVIAISETPFAGTVPFEEFLLSGGSVSAEQLQTAKARVKPRDEALLQFTSGTTAFPKAARLFHTGILRGAVIGADQLDLTARDRYFSAQPFYHCGGSVVIILAPIVSGCEAAIQPYFEPGKALEIMERERSTVTIGHQPHFIEYMNHPEFSGRRLELERIVTMASPEVNLMLRDKVGTEGLVSGYGMTETHLHGTSTHLTTDSLETRLLTVGRPHSGVQLQIRDPETGRVLPDCEQGEIHLLVPYLMSGYLDDPEQTAAVVDSNGWYRTGDMGRIDEDGNLRLVGRVKDMIRVGGENLASAEVEACLLRHPAVRQTAVVAGPNQRLGEVVVAFVQLKAGATVTEAGLIEHCRAHLASFKVPRAVHFVDELPMSGTGKIQKFVLKELLNA